jgi:CheY-like chemotaxis protein
MADQVHILCVDDEPRVLEGLVLNLRRQYRVSTATNGLKGLEIIDGDDPPAVVVSDMRMPEMDGAAFLSRVKDRSPDTVRILLTGQADLDSAIAAVNHGQVFRFLTKPCSPQSFLAAIQAASDQHRLITAERELLEKTLRGSIKALTEILSLSNPLAFGRAMRLKKHAADLVAGLGVPLSWQVEVAVMLSQIGCVTLPAATNEKLYYGRPLNSDETELTQRVPALSLQLLESIPRCGRFCKHKTTTLMARARPTVPRRARLSLWAHAFSSSSSTMTRLRRPAAIRPLPSVPCRAEGAATTRRCSMPWLA